MLTRIDIRQIIKDHTKTLSDENGNIYKSEILVFLIMPALIAIIIKYYFNIDNKVMSTNLITTASIFTGLLLNLLLLVFNLNEKTNLEETSKTENPLLYAKKSNMVKLLKETYANISFSILLSITIICISLASLIFETKNNKMIDYILSTSNIFLSILFILTILMILKRIHFLFSSQNS